MKTLFPAVCLFSCLIAAQSFAGSATSADQTPGRVAWALTQSMHTQRNGHTATLLSDGRVLAAGGYGPEGLALYAELYDPMTAQWSKTPSLGYGVVAHTATLLPDGRVLIAGGSQLSDGGVTAGPNCTIRYPARGAQRPT